MKLRRCNCQRCYACAGQGCVHCKEGIRCRHPEAAPGTTFGLFIFRNGGQQTAFCRLKGEPPTTEG